MLRFVRVEGNCFQWKINNKKISILRTAKTQSKVETEINDIYKT